MLLNIYELHITLGVTTRLTL